MPAKAAWEEAARNTLRHGARLTLYEKIQWLEEIEEVFLCMQGSSGGRGDAARISASLSIAEDKPTQTGGESRV